MAQNPFYVYALKDPRSKPSKPFYIGKGTGNRAWEHQANIDDSEKGQVIREIIESNNKVIHTIIADDLTEVQALKIEAELISAFGVRSKGGLLTNRVVPNAENIGKRIKVNVPDGCYEKSQVSINMLKSSVMEFAKANPDGVRNSDVAKFLGMQSDYGGGSKDYLSYSILGLLMKEGRIKRLPGGRHVASGE
ncbi:MAG: GIY-YIG nuclease family protein [Rhodospirillaceae bacterium]